MKRTMIKPLITDGEWTLYHYEEFDKNITLMPNIALIDMDDERAYDGEANAIFISQVKKMAEYLEKDWERWNEQIESLTEHEKIQLGSTGLRHLEDSRTEIESILSLAGYKFE